MYERILVPLDGSKIGEAALPYVEDLVSKLSPNVKVEVILLQVLSPEVPYVVGGGQFLRLTTLRKRWSKTGRKLSSILMRLLKP